MEMNVDKKLVIVYGKYNGEITAQLGTDIYRVQYKAKGETITRSFLGSDIEYK